VIQTKIGPASVSQKPVEKKKSKWESILDQYKTLDELDSSNPGVQYAKRRMIPEARYCDIYYLDEFTKFCSEFDTKMDNFDRVGFCLRKKNGDIYGMNCRVIDSTLSSARYITFKDEDEIKVFGLNTVDDTKPVYVLEGPIDSMFVDNSVAMMGSSVDMSEIGLKDVVYVYDNEPRNREICRQIKGKIDSGQKVVIWPETVLQKDINDMVIDGVDAKKVIKENTYSGLTAMAKFSQWRKI
jgi:hypothetical protein